MALIDVDWRPGSKQLRQFSALFLVLISLAAMAWRYKEWITTPTMQILIAVAIVVGGVGLLLPRLVLPVYVVMMAVALPIGMVLSTVLLSVIFYLIMTPIGLIMRIFGYDAMHRRFDRSAETYWIRRSGAPQAGQYFKQF